MKTLKQIACGETEVTVRGYELSLRKADAEMIEVI